MSLPALYIASVRIPSSPMASKDWQKELRSATSTILSAVADLHPPRPPAARLAAAAADALQLQERVNIDLQDALRRERDWRKAAERRIATLEEKLETVLNPSLEENFESRSALKEKPPVFQEEKSPLVDGKKQEARPSCKRRAKTGVHFSMEQSPLKKKRNSESDDPIENASFGQSCPNLEKAVRQNARRSEPPVTPKLASGEYTGEEPTVEGRTKRVRAEKSLPVTPPRKPLPPLPTLKDVERDWAQRRAEKRAKEQYKPPPCDKCRLRKRAVMLRQDGYIKEDVFDRWAKKPGNCLDYMHQDEEVPEGQGRYSLSFEETETQSP